MIYEYEIGISTGNKRLERTEEVKYLIDGNNRTDVTDQLRKSLLTIYLLASSLQTIQSGWVYTTTVRRPSLKVSMRRMANKLCNETLENESQSLAALIFD